MHVDSIKLQHEPIQQTNAKPIMLLRSIRMGEQDNNKNKQKSRIKIWK